MCIVNGMPINGMPINGMPINGRFQGPISISDRTCYCKISQSLKDMKFMFRIVWSLWNLTDISAALLISRLRDFTRSYDTTTYRFPYLLKQSEIYKLKPKHKHFYWTTMKSSIAKIQTYNKHTHKHENEMKWKHAEGTITLTSGTPWWSFLCSCLARAYIDTRVLNFSRDSWCATWVHMYISMYWYTHIYIWTHTQTFTNTHILKVYSTCAHVKSYTYIQCLRTFFPSYISLLAKKVVTPPLKTIKPMWIELLCFHLAEIGMIWTRDCSPTKSDTTLGRHSMQGQVGSSSSETTV